MRMRKCFCLDQSIYDKNYVNYRTKMAKKEIVVDQKTSTQIWKRYITYFKHKRPRKNETKTKQRNWRYAIFFITTVKSAPGKCFMKS